MLMVEYGSGDFDKRPLLKAMFRARKQVFVDLLKWDVPVLSGEFEIDQFDDEAATYLIVAGPNGVHFASARLLQTTKPHILESLFPQLCAGPVPAGRGILEITRFCLDRSLPALKRREARNLLVSGLVSFALDHGVRTYTGVAEMGWLQQILAFGWDCRPLGVPQQIGATQLGALAITITAETPHLLSRNRIWISEPLTEAQLPQAA